MLPLYTTEGHGSLWKVTEAHGSCKCAFSHSFTLLVYRFTMVSCQRTGWTSRLTFYSLKFYWSPNKTKSLLNKTNQSSSKTFAEGLQSVVSTRGLCDVSCVSCVEQFLVPPPTISIGPHFRVHPRLAWKSSEQSFCLIFPSAGIMGWDFRNTASCSSLFSFSKVYE